MHKKIDNPKIKIRLILNICFLDIIYTPFPKTLKIGKLHLIKISKQLEDIL
ncbi:hypothetical protein JCM16816_10480 [Thermoanaerobacter brockii subsp. lactiethylicus]